MIVKTVILVFVLFDVWNIRNNYCYSLPIDNTQKLDDTVVVDSVIREVRAIPPNAFHQAKNSKKISDDKDLVQAGTSDDPDNFEHHWSSDDGGDKGYIKNEEGKGSSGYKHFDSYAKKDGDKYDFEHHTSFGHGDKNEKAHNSKYSEADNNEDVGKKQDNKKGEGTHNSYQVSENVSEDDDYFEPYNAISGNYENEDDGSESSDKSNYNNEQESADETDGNEEESEAYTADDDEGEEESSQFTDASEKDEESENLEEYDEYE